MAAHRRGNDARERLTRLRDAYLYGGVPRDLRRSDVEQLLRFVRLAPPWSKRAADVILADWENLDGGPSSTDFRQVVDRTFGAMAIELPNVLFQQVAEEDHGPRPLPPIRPLDPVPVAPHGRVRRGRLDAERPGEAALPHIFLWLERGNAAPCREYAWYQFVHGSIWLGADGAALRDLTGDLKKRTFKADTGLPVTLCTWCPDYQAEEIESMEKQTRRELPTFRPPGRQFRQVGQGKPYLERPIQNEDGQVGLVDAPNWCSRAHDKKGREIPAPIELAWSHLPERDCKRHAGKPPEGRDRVEIRMEFRSYLVCLDTMRCIGYQSWTAASAATISYDWHPKRGAPPEGGIVTPSTPREWCPHQSIDGIAHRLAIGDWTPC